IGEHTSELQSRPHLVCRLFFRSESVVRSEEHTSELQSRPHVVCRLLLEKLYNFRMVHRGPPCRSSPGKRTGGFDDRPCGASQAFFHYPPPPRIPLLPCRLPLRN